MWKFILIWLLRHFKVLRNFKHKFLEKKNYGVFNVIKHVRSLWHNERCSCDAMW